MRVEATRHAPLLTVLLLAAATTAGAQSPADGWSGQVQCVTSARGIGYQDDQTHTWVLSGPPKALSDFRDYPAVWTVSGSGRRTPISARAAAAGAGDSWTHSGSDAGTSIRLFVPVGTNAIRIAAGQLAVKAPNGIKGTGASGPFAADLDEWRFKYIDVVNGAAQARLSGSRTETRIGLVGWRPPPGTTVTETCTWSLTKSVVDQSRIGRPGGAASAGGAAAAGGTGAAGSASGAEVKGGAAGGAATGGTGGGAAAGGATGGASTTSVSNADVTRQYAAIGRTPTPGTGVVFATLVDSAGAPLTGVPVVDIHLMDGSAQPAGIGPYVFGVVGDVVDNGTLSVTSSFGGRSRVAFLDVPAGTFTLTLNVSSGGRALTRSVQVTTSAGAATVVQLSAGGPATGSSGRTTGSAGASGGATSAMSPDVVRQYTAIGLTPTAGTGVVFATLVDNAGAPLVGVFVADIHLLDGTSLPVGLGPYVFGPTGDIVDNNTLSATAAFNGRSRVAFLDVPLGRLTLTVIFSSSGKVVTRSAQVVTTAGGITLAQP